jgi:hypothetical protein
VSEQFLRAALAALNASDEAGAKENGITLEANERFAATDMRLNSSPDRLATSVLAIMTKLRLE